MPWREMNRVCFRYLWPYKILPSGQKHPLSCSQRDWECYLIISHKQFIFLSCLKGRKKLKPKELQYIVLNGEGMKKKATKWMAATGSNVGSVDWHCNTVLILLMGLNCHDLSDMEIEPLISVAGEMSTFFKLWDRLKAQFTVSMRLL